jgi:hypothetical protein
VKIATFNVNNINKRLPNVRPQRSRSGNREADKLHAFGGKPRRREARAFRCGAKRAIIAGTGSWEFRSFGCLKT